MTRTTEELRTTILTVSDEQIDTFLEDVQSTPEHKQVRELSIYPMLFKVAAGILVEIGVPSSPRAGNLLGSLIRLIAAAAYREGKQDGKEPQ